MIKVAIVGYGNIGKYAVDALRAAPDMELAGIVRRPGSEAVHGIKTVSDVEELGHVDAALLCTPHPQRGRNGPASARPRRQHSRQF